MFALKCEDCGYNLRVPSMLHQNHCPFCGSVRLNTRLPLRVQRAFLENEPAEEPDMDLVCPTGSIMIVVVFAIYVAAHVIYGLWYGI